MSVNRSIEAVAQGTHGDPFAVLGPHRDDKGWWVRAMLPWAEAVTLVTPRRRAPMRKAHPDGVFAVHLKVKGKPTYTFEATKPDGTTVTVADPYALGPWLGDLDRHFMAEGTHLDLYRKLGAHPVAYADVEGTAFAVWAPGARRVSVIGDFNSWDGRCHPMRFNPGCGVWEIVLPGVGRGALYKFEIIGADGTLLPQKADPFGFAAEHPPATASRVEGLSAYVWHDADWMAARGDGDPRRKPMSIYEVHLGSWRRVPEDGNRPLSYREMADQLVPYVKDLGFTHIELLPVSEFPFEGSWGYQPIGLFAPTSRYGTPDDLRHFVDTCHQAGLGVILDWVVGHFPEDAHGLAQFDGTHLYEHADPRLGRHMDWGTLIYNYGRTEVANVLLANALYWVEQFHIDGLRVDAVASMLYLDYSRPAGEWLPNRFGGRENLEAVAFLKRVNEVVYARGQGAITIAEESTAWPQVSRPTSGGGLGFGFKWNMGWMNDTLRYMQRDPIHRQHHHNDLTFGLLYAFDENFVLPLSHDEVVHGKGSLLGRMPGDDWQRFANLRAYLGFMMAHPGKKLLFMGAELAQAREWDHDGSLDWHLLEHAPHRGVQALVRDMNRLYRSIPALHARDCEPGGFAWIEADGHAQSVLAFLRRDSEAQDDVVVVACNMTPVVREGYAVGLPEGGRWEVLLNTDSTFYGGANVGPAAVDATWEQATHGQSHGARITLPPLATVVLRPARLGGG